MAGACWRYLNRRARFINSLLCEMLLLKEGLRVGVAL